MNELMLLDSSSIGLNCALVEWESHTIRAELGPYLSSRLAALSRCELASPMGSRVQKESRMGEARLRLATRLPFARKRENRARNGNGNQIHIRIPSSEFAFSPKSEARIQWLKRAFQ